MSYPTSLKDLLELCQQNGLKFKGKRIAQLIELLEANSVSADGVFEEDIATLPVKCLREKCKEIGLSVYGTKAELIRRLKSSSNEAVSIPVVQWRERGRRIPTRPSETKYLTKCYMNNNHRQWFYRTQVGPEIRNNLIFFEFLHFFKIYTGGKITEKDFIQNVCIIDCIPLN